MKKLVLLSLIILLSKLNVISQTLPAAWKKGGNMAGSYIMELKPNEGLNKSNAIVLQSTGKDIWGSGAILQKISAYNYLGKRIKLSAYIKTENVKNYTSLILKQENDKRTEEKNEDNYSEKTIQLTGTFEYKKIETYLNVYNQEDNIVFGAILNGEGKIWLDDFNIEIEGNAPELKTELSKEPLNLEFEDSLIIPTENKIGYKIEGDLLIFQYIPSQFETTTDGMNGWRQQATDIKIKEVHVAGDFNNWEPKNKKYLMKLKDNKYELALPLEMFKDKKIHEFKFVINGKKWVEPKPEMQNKTQSGNWEGNFNLMILL
jgi:hypothetical protein